VPATPIKPSAVLPVAAPPLARVNAAAITGSGLRAGIPRLATSHHQEIRYHPEAGSTPYRRDRARDALKMPRTYCQCRAMQW
jgi:hypothetical protein